MEQLEENLREVAREFLTLESQNELEIKFQDGDLPYIQRYLLGVVDRHWKKGNVNDEQARVAYEKIGLSSEQAAEIRSKGKAWTE